MKAVAWRESLGDGKQIVGASEEQKKNGSLIKKKFFLCSEHSCARNPLSYLLSSHLISLYLILSYPVSSQLLSC